MGPRDVLINWSLSMDMRRRGFGPVNWGNTLSVLPDEETCESTSVPQVDVIWGTFEVNATVPEGQNPIILVQALSPCSCLLRTVSQSPHVRQIGDQAFLLGNLKELASWNAQEAVKMMKQPNTSSTWTAVVSVSRLQILSHPSSSYTIDKWHLKKKNQLPATTSFQYKYILQHSGVFNNSHPFTHSPCWWNLLMSRPDHILPLKQMVNLYGRKALIEAWLLPTLETLLVMFYWFWWQALIWWLFFLGGGSESDVWWISNSIFLHISSR